MTDEAKRQQLLKRIKNRAAREKEHWVAAPEKFLAAWIQGVRTVGESFFTCQSPYEEYEVKPATSLNEITDKWQLAPNMNYIENNINALTGGEAILLCVMCSFYDNEWGGKLMRYHGLDGFAGIASKLHLECRDIITELFLNYTEW